MLCAMSDTFLGTNDVAALLRVSRQHVANMCDRGEIDCYVATRIREIPLDEVQRWKFLTEGWSDPNYQEALIAHVCVAAELLSDPQTCTARASAWLDDRRGEDDGYVERAVWRELLSRPVNETIAAILDSGPYGRALRRHSPFTA